MINTTPIPEREESSNLDKGKPSDFLPKAKPKGKFPWSAEIERRKAQARKKP